MPSEHGLTGIEFRDWGFYSFKKAIGAAEAQRKGAVA